MKFTLQKLTTALLILYGAAGQEVESQPSVEECEAGECGNVEARGSSTVCGNKKISINYRYVSKGFEKEENLSSIFCTDKGAVTTTKSKTFSKSITLEGSWSKMKETFSLGLGLSATFSEEWTTGTTYRFDVTKCGCYQIKVKPGFAYGEFDEKIERCCTTTPPMIPMIVDELDVINELDVLNNEFRCEYISTTRGTSMVPLGQEESEFYLKRVSDATESQCNNGGIPTLDDSDADTSTGRSQIFVPLPFEII